ncbi:SDR family oxidoreductase [Patescibacteria group bacterium]|nr:SDR family oxidoreductase [Patescibacteria group bacterium]
MKKTILVTGSSRGIGRAIVELADARGYQVIIHGKTDSRELNETHKKLKGSIKVFFDISKPKEVEKGIKKLLAKVKTVDVLVNNAGIRANPMKTLDDLNIEGARLEWDTNVMGTLYCIKAVLPAMLKKGYGSVVSIASIKGQYSLATTSSLTFSATKSAIISITKSLAKTYSEQGVRFNSVSPGYVETDQVHDWSPDTLKRIKEGTLSGRMAKPSEIAGIVLFLVSEEANYITGVDYLIDGGYMLKGK